MMNTVIKLRKWNWIDFENRIRLEFTKHPKGRTTEDNVEKNICQLSEEKTENNCKLKPTQTTDLDGNCFWMLYAP